MGGSKSSQSSSTNSSQSGSAMQERQPTPEETRLNQLDLQLREATNPYLQQMQVSGLKLGTQLLEGKTPLPGWMEGMEAGISPEITQSIVDKSLKDVNYQMAGTGTMDSGTRASVLARTSGDIRRASEEFNIGNRLNLLNLALTGQAQIQQPQLGYSANLGQRLTTLGPTTKTYSGSSNSNTNMLMRGGGSGWTFGM
jgi:hypothetical protein